MLLDDSGAIHGLFPLQHIGSVRAKLALFNALHALFDRTMRYAHPEWVDPWAMWRTLRNARQNNGLQHPSRTLTLPLISPSPYALLKFAHVFIAIVALGTSAGLGMLLELFGNDPTHGAFVLRAIRRLTYLVVMPGYALMAVTGLWLTRLSWSLAIGWIQAALVLWCAGVVLLGLSAASLRRASLAGRLYGGGFGLVVVAILYLMVAKP